MVMAIVENLGLEGVTMAPAPPTRREPGRTEDDSQQETGNSARPSSQRVGGRAPLRPARRRCSCPTQEEMQEREQTQHGERRPQKRREKRKTPPETPENRPRTKPKTPEPRTEKQPLGRRKNPETRHYPGFPGRKNRKSQKQNSDRTDLEDEHDEDERVEPLGQKETPRPPGTAGVSFCPAPVSQKREESKKILKSSSSSWSSRSHQTVVVTIPTPAQGRSKTEKERERNRQTQNDKG